MFNPFRKRQGPGVGGAQPAPGAIEEDGLWERVIEAIRTVYDPELPVNVYDLGLIYDLEIDAEQKVSIRMTLTAPACPVAGTLPGEVQRAVGAVPGVRDARVELVWDPPWAVERMSEAARLELGML
jgi:FeS assembly SUF system protein